MGKNNKGYHGQKHCGVKYCHGEKCNNTVVLETETYSGSLFDEHRQSINTAIPQPETKPNERFYDELYSGMKESLTNSEEAAKPFWAEVWKGVVQKEVDNEDFQTVFEHPDEAIMSACDEIEAEIELNDGNIDFDHEKKKAIFYKLNTAIAWMIDSEVKEQNRELKKNRELGQTQFKDHQVNADEFVKNDSYASRVLSLKLPISEILLDFALNHPNPRIRKLASFHPQHRSIEDRGARITGLRKEIDWAVEDILKSVKSSIDSNKAPDGAVIVSGVTKIVEKKFTIAQLEEAMTNQYNISSDTKKKVASLFGAKILKK